MIDHGILGVDIMLDMCEMDLHEILGPWRAHMVAEMYNDPKLCLRNRSRSEELFGKGSEITYLDVWLAEQEYMRDMLDMPPQSATLGWLYD